MNYYEAIDYGSEFLAHHGIFGMKWGIRRYQNEDGSLTPAGKKRYGNGSTEKDRHVETKEERKARILASRSSEELYKNAPDFETSELKAAYDRLKLEKDIKNLNPKVVKNGDYYIKKTIDLSKSVADIAGNLTKIYASYTAITKLANGQSVDLPKDKDKGKK